MKTFVAKILITQSLIEELTIGAKSMQDAIDALELNENRELLSIKVESDNLLFPSYVHIDDEIKEN